MIDMNAYDAVPLVVAQALAPNKEAPVPNWLSKRKTPDAYRRSVDRYKSSTETINYTEVGSNGLPVLRSNIYLEKAWGEQGVDLAEGSCMEIDLAARMAGSWGPDCIIEKFTKLPKKGLPKVEGHDLYLFTPSGARTEEARFILSNGAGRKCEVIVTFHVPRRTASHAI